MVQGGRVIAIIPARMGSSRFPGKPLASILGRSMIEHVYRRTAMCQALHAVYVATCDEEIYRAVEQYGGQAVMTSDRHQRASDRVAEAALHIDADIVVMVQGDEPMTYPGMIEQAIEPLLLDPSVQCVNLVKRIASEDEFLDPNTIKVATDRNWNALYFSREPIPSRRQGGYDSLIAYKQVCIIPFRRDFLFRYAELAPTPLEQAESIDMLRVLEHGYKVRLVETEFPTHAVDTIADLRHVEQLMRDDPLTWEYCEK
ncbi:MAG: 3-deoxy-manno-octulosonate cytidylyltransferase [Chloroflexi bacterium]|nr:3-deoxy-manno-octulosonate cytidylyltransferase [Chloroflexota bacterium]